MVVANTNVVTQKGRAASRWGCLWGVSVGAENQQCLKMVCMRRVRETEKTRMTSGFWLQKLDMWPGTHQNWESEKRLD